MRKIQAYIRIFNHDLFLTKQELPNKRVKRTKNPISKTIKSFIKSHRRHTDKNRINKATSIYRRIESGQAKQIKTSEKDLKRNVSIQLKHRSRANRSEKSYEDYQKQIPICLGEEKVAENK